MAIYLSIPYDQTQSRDLAKKHGAKWQPQSKLWKLDGDVPESLQRFAIEVVAVTYSLETLIDSRFERPLELLKAVYEEADLNEESTNPTREPHWQVLELVGQTPLTPGTKIPARSEVQRLARDLAAQLLWKTGQRELAIQLRKEGE